MNPRERFLATIHGEAADRVPLELEGFELATRAELAACEDPRRREIAERVFDRTAVPVLCPSFVNRYLVTPPQSMREVRREQAPDGTETTTTRIDTPGGPLTAITSRNPASNTIWTVKYPVESLEDIARIRSVPWRLPPGLHAPDASQRPEDFDQRRYSRTGVSSPFVCVAGMMPYQLFLELCAVRLDLMLELTELCRQRIADVLDVLLADGTIEYVWMGGCEWLTPPMGSPKLYEQLVQPFEEAIIRQVHDASAVAHVHCHGNVRSTLELVIQRGGDLFEPVEPPPDGDLTFAEAKALAAGRITLAGNLEARVLENGSAEQVEAAARAAFEGGKDRMILRNSACPIGPVTGRMLGNYHRAIDVWEELSPL
jgi:hypothetical protein